MNLVIAYLYYDLLDQYGESGNLKELITQLKTQGITPIIKNLSLNDELNFNEYDLVLISAGTENNQKLALKHLINYKEQIKEAIENNKFFLITGNSIDLFGKTIKYLNGQKYKSLGIFDYYVTSSEKRIVGDVLFKDDNYIIGFQNKCSIMHNITNPLFTCIYGYKDKIEGIHYKNFYGTYILGPLLVRNPVFTENFIKQLILSKDKDFIFKDFDLEFETLAYDNFLEKHYKEFFEQ